MTVTILTCTARTEPHFDWLADSIANSVLEQPIELEWVVIDAKLWGPDATRRRIQLANAVRGRFEFSHLPPKPCRWQGPNRLTQSDYFALNNARNSGLIVARGDRIILLDDCTVVDTVWLKHHLAATSYGLAGTYRTHHTATVIDGEVVRFTDGPYGWDPRRSIAPTFQRTNGGWGFGLNTSFPLAAAVAVNGFDELYDGQGGSEDADFGVRAERSGTIYFWDPDCIVFQILDTHEAVFEHVGWNQPTVPRRKPKELVIRRDNQSHFANEALIERLVLDEPTRFLPLGNNFSLTSARDTWKSRHEFEVGKFEEFDWRDGEKLSSMK